MLKIATYALSMVISLYSFFHIFSYFSQLDQLAGGASSGVLRGFYIFASFFGLIASMAAIARIVMVKNGLSGFITNSLVVVVVISSIVAFGGSALFAWVKFADVEGKSALLSTVTGPAVLDVCLAFLLALALFLPNVAKERKFGV